ncbi:nuclear transport factor 2 family protein [Oceanisphaera sediminis]|uniref:Nuclear transport factor 2 family protein n=1 Tax=Oceanisphaera sediminis TaxID=981381 RepID=A0ABP7EHN5_9GAMM
MSPALTVFCREYQRLSPNHLEGLYDIYAPDIRFCDPAHEIQGIASLVAYFDTLFTQVTACRFDIEQVMEQDGEALVRWQMVFCHPRLNGGKEVQVPGVSHLRFAEQVYEHTDYFDMGAMLYEQLPLLGGVIRALKRRLNQ